MDEHIRVSDADRERVAARLREHYAEGRLSSDELDERIAAALNAKTVGDLRAIMADLPEPEPVMAQGSQSLQPMPPRYPVRRAPRLLPLALLVIFAALVLHGAGWVLFGVFQTVILFWLLASVAGFLVASRVRRHLRRRWQSDDTSHWHDHDWRQ